MSSERNIQASEQRCDARKRLPAFLAVLGGCVLIGGIVFAWRTTPPHRGTIQRNSIDGLEYVWIPAGGLRVGCSAFDSICGPEEKPAHDVTISSGFWIGRTEVTVAAYRRFVAASGNRIPAEPMFGDRSLNPGWRDPELPVVNVSWDDARSFCQWAGGALPTEAQWEYAARGGNSRPQYGEIKDIAWFGDNAGAAPLDTAALIKQDPAGFLGRLSVNGNTFHRVGLLAPNDAGVQDILGNVWEWTADWFGENYADTLDRFDPVGRSEGAERALRGGSWTNPRETIRVSARGHRPPATQSIDTGFRCVR